MIRWVFLFAVAAFLVWMFADSRATRTVGFGVLGFIALVSLVFFYVLDDPDRREAAAPPKDAAIERVEEVTRKLRAERFSLKPDDVALVGTVLKPDIRISYTNEGEKVETPDLFSWVVDGEARNVSEKHTVQDVYLRVRLFDCPSFFTTEQASTALDELNRTCSRIGERNLGLYGLGIEPGGTKAFKDKVNFSDQVEPRNWRYWISVDRVNAVAR
ncbi:MAG: hypothetical protein AAF441_03270 [Pseudomonadota bacterium]